MGLLAATLRFGLLSLSISAIQACHPGIQPNYCVQFALANLTYQPRFHGDNTTYASGLSFEKDVNTGLAKAIQFDVLRVLQAKNLCGRVLSGPVECFRDSGITSPYPNQTLLKVFMKVATSLTGPELEKLFREMYSSPLPDPSFYKLYQAPVLTTVSHAGTKCGC